MVVVHIWGGGGSTRLFARLWAGLLGASGRVGQIGQGKVSGSSGGGQEASAAEALPRASSSCNGMVVVEQELMSTENSRRGGQVSNAVVFCLLVGLAPCGDWVELAVCGINSVSSTP